LHTIWNFQTCWGKGRLGGERRAITFLDKGKRENDSQGPHLRIGGQEKRESKGVSFFLRGRELDGGLSMQGGRKTPFLSRRYMTRQSQIKLQHMIDKTFQPEGDIRGVILLLPRSCGASDGSVRIKLGGGLGGKNIPKSGKTLN